MPIDDAEEHIFGLCLLNDWSARDIQAWESQPLGPFLAKNFATSLSPWVVTLDALAPFRRRPAARPRRVIRPAAVSTAGTTTRPESIAVEVSSDGPLVCVSRAWRNRLSRGSFGNVLDAAQMVTHHTSNGCNLSSGDMIASGTVSGPRAGSRGCLIELTRGSHPVQLARGEERTFLADGDEVIVRGYCERSGYARVGFGECRGVVLPAVVAPAKSP